MATQTRANRKSESNVQAQGNNQSEGKNMTKMAQCRIIYDNNSDLSRREVMDMFINQAGCSEAGAATYYAICKKEASTQEAPKSNESNERVSNATNRSNRSSASNQGEYDVSMLQQLAESTAAAATAAANAAKAVTAMLSGKGRGNNRGSSSRASNGDSQQPAY